MAQPIIEQVIVLRKPAIATIIVTAVALFLCLILMRNLSITGRFSKVLGIFVGLKDRSAFHLTFAWIKYIYFCSTLCIMQYAQGGHYAIIGFFIVVCAFLAKESRLIIMEIVGGLLSIASTWVCSVFVDYINNIRSDFYVVAAYWIIAVFMILCATVVFLYELMSISREREKFEANWDQE